MMEARGVRSTRTSAFGVGRREGHDASDFYARFAAPTLSGDEHIARSDELLRSLGRGRVVHGDSTTMRDLPDDSVALVVTSPPYFVGKEYELAVAGQVDGEVDGEPTVPETYLDFLTMLRDVFAECRRVLEPGGRIAVNVANLGRKPYRSLSADVITILQDDLGLLLRGEVIWEKSSASSGSCAWGSFAKASNPVLRDVTERVIIASKGRFARAVSLKDRRARGLPHESTLTNDEFVDVTRDVWRLDAESATRVGHPAPFPVELPRRLIDLYTYRDDIVVDPFVGSGSTLVAAARTGRIGVGYDLDRTYVELAEQRLADELERSDQLDDTSRSIETASPAERQQLVGTLSPDHRQEYFRARASSEAKRVNDIAERHLRDAGFEVHDLSRSRAGVVDVAFRVTSADGSAQWWVDVVGAFTTSQPGLQRMDAVWRTLGRLHVLRSIEQEGHRVLLLTPSLPRPGSPGDRALRAVGPDVIFDAIELYEPAGLERLSRYASDPARPLPGFWTERDIATA